MQTMMPALSVSRPAPVNVVRSAAMKNAAYFAHIKSAHSSGASTPLRPASPFLSGKLAASTADQSRLYRQYRSSLTPTTCVQQHQQHQQQQHQQTSPAATTIEHASEPCSATVRRPSKRTRKAKRSATAYGGSSSTTASSSHSPFTFPAKLLRFILLHLPLAMFAALQLCIALVVAPFLLMFAIGVACGAAFLVALLDMWNPRWWCSVKAHVGSVLRPAHHSRRASSPATSMMSPCRSTSSSGSESKEEEGEEEEKPLYERLIDDERRRVRSETEKVRARRRQQASTLPRLPSSAAGMGASLVSGLASAIDTPPSYNSLPARRPHRPGASNLRMYTTTHSDVNDSSSNNNSNNHNGASASYRDAAAELAALFGNKQQTAPASIPDGLLGQTTSPSIVLDQQRRPDRVGMSRMA